jgi:hypothetical protein
MWGDTGTLPHVNVHTQTVVCASARGYMYVHICRYPHLAIVSPSILSIHLTSHSNTV